MKGEGGVSNTWCQGKGEERSSLAASLFLSSCRGAKFTFALSLFSLPGEEAKKFSALCMTYLSSWLGRYGIRRGEKFNFLSCHRTTISSGEKDVFKRK